MKDSWILGVSNSAGGEVEFFASVCTVEQMKQIMLKKAKEDAKNNASSFEYGLENISEIKEIIHDKTGRVMILNAHNVFMFHSVTYTAHRMDLLPYCEPEN